MLSRPTGLIYSCCTCYRYLLQRRMESTCLVDGEGEPMMDEGGDSKDGDAGNPSERVSFEHTIPVLYIYIQVAPMPAMVVFPLARDLTFPLLSTLNRRREVSSNVLSSSFLHLLPSLNCHRPNKAQDSTVRLPAASHSVRPPLTLLSYLPHPIAQHRHGKERDSQGNEESTR